MNGLIEAILPPPPVAVVLFRHLAMAGARHHASSHESEIMRARLLALGRHVWGPAQESTAPTRPVPLSPRADAILVMVFFALARVQEPLPLRPILEYLEGPERNWFAIDDVLGELTRAGILHLDSQRNGHLMCTLGMLATPLRAH